MKRNILFGLTGFLSLLGFVGIFTEARSFLAFFAFAVDFQYFFLPSDEMAEQQLARSAALGFYAGMLVTAGGTLWGIFSALPAGEALLEGFALGWAAAVIVHALSAAWYGFRERLGAADD